MAKKKARKARRVQVGDRVRFSIGDLVIEADVIEDRGQLGTVPHHVVSVAWTDQAGDPQRMDWPSAKMAVLPCRRSSA